MSDAFDVTKCRRQFPGLRRQVAGRPAVFLDGPGGSQVPQCVIDAVADCLGRYNANEGGPFATSREIVAMLASARLAVADFLGSLDPDTIVFGPNMTTLTFSLSRSLARTWKAGDEIVVTRLDHDANITPWVMAASDAGATVRHLDVNPKDCTLCLDQLDRVVTDRTRLVAVGMASNAVGTVNPLATIIAAAHEKGSLVFVDAVHAAPHLPIDVKDMNCDFLACSAYKFFGPHLGILWGRRELLETLQAYKVRPAPDTGPEKWMTGTPSFEAIAGTLAAVEYLAGLGRADGNGRMRLLSEFSAIRGHELALAQHFLKGFSRLGRWRLWGISEAGRPSDRVPTFALTHAHLSARDVAADLAEQGIFAWPGNFYAVELVEALGLASQGMLRIGFLHYNTMEEVDRLLEALNRL